MQAYVIIKGNKFQAAQAAAERNIPLAFNKETDAESIGIAVATVDELNAWLCELPNSPPFPVGALLHWAPKGA